MYEVRMIVFGAERQVGFFQGDSPTVAIENAQNQGLLQLPFEQVVTVAAISESGLVFQFTMCQA